MRNTLLHFNLHRTLYQRPKGHAVNCCMREPVQTEHEDVNKLVQASPESASAPSPCSTGPSKGNSNITLSLRFLKLFKCEMKVVRMNFLSKICAKSGFKGLAYCGGPEVICDQKWNKPIILLPCVKYCKEKDFSLEVDLQPSCRRCRMHILIINPHEGYNTQLCLSIRPSVRHSSILSHFSYSLTSTSQLSSSNWPHDSKGKGVCK